jgi:hypothetical protein
MKALFDRINTTRGIRILWTFVEQAHAAIDLLGQALPNDIMTS